MYVYYLLFKPLTDQLKSLISKTFVTIGAPTAGGAIGIVSFFEDITPILTVISLTTAIILGILSYRLKLKQSKKNEKRD